MSFLIFAIEAADRDSRIQYFVWLVLALSCKWYVGIPVAFYGLILWKAGNRQIGKPTLLLGIFWSLAAMLILLPIFAPQGQEAVQARATITTYLTSRFKQLDLRSTWFLRLGNAIIVALPAVIVLGWRSPLWLLPAAAVGIPALLSSGFGPAFSYRTHHYAVAVPFLMSAIVFGAYRLRQREGTAADEVELKKYRWNGRVLLTFVALLIFHIAFVDSPLNPNFYLAKDGSATGLDIGKYGIIDRDNY